MDNDNGKITTRQAAILCILLFCAPAVRYIPVYATTIAHEAAWLTPLVGFVFAYICILVWNKIYQKYGSKSFVEILTDVTGVWIGRTLTAVYFVWITFLTAYYLRMYAERILTTTSPNSHIVLIVGAMVILIGYIVKYGVITLAKMGEVFFILFSIIFIVYNILILPRIHMTNLLPITTDSIVPVIQGSMSYLTLFSYLAIIFMFGDKINFTKNFKRDETVALIIKTIIAMILIIVSIGVYGSSVVAKLPIPYLSAMMEISLFDIIERVESGIIIFWVVTEFILITVFVSAAMNIIRKSFNLNNIRPLTSVYLLGIFFFALIIGRSTLELKMFSEKILTPLDILLGCILPIIIYIIAKIRKKV